MLQRSTETNKVEKGISELKKGPVQSLRKSTMKGHTKKNSSREQHVQVHLLFVGSLDGSGYHRM